MGKRISEADLRAELQRVADEIGEPPTVRQFDELGAYSEGTVRDRFGSWSDALAAAGLDTAGSKRPVPKAELLEELRELAAELGHPPTGQQMNAQGPRWASVYQRRFGSWNDALGEAGLEPRTSRGTAVSISREELLAELQSLADEFDRRPRVSDMVDEGAYAVNRYRDEFGSWGAALEAADIETDEIPDRIPTERLCAAITSVADDVDRPPTTTEFADHSEYGVSTVIRRFGSWNDALEAAGLDPDAPRGSQADDEQAQTLKISDEELLRSIREIATDDEPPTLQEYREDGEYGAQTIYDRFGSWNAAVEDAGFGSRDPDGKIPKSDLLDELRRIADKDGDPPTVAEMREEGAHWVSTYRNRFGSWNDALAAAGFEPRSTPKPSREELIAALQDLASELDKRPSISNMDEHGAYRPSTYRTVFGSWTAALEAAGVDQDRDRGPSGKISEETLIANMQAFADELGHAPTAQEMNVEGPHSKATYQKRFGLWSEAVETALADWTPPTDDE